MLTLVRGARVSLVLEDRGWCPPVEPELALGHFIGVPVGVLPCAVVDPHQRSTVEPLAEHGGFPPHRVGVPGIPEPRRVGRNGHRKRERIDAQQGCEHFVSQALPGSRPVHVSVPAQTGDPGPDGRVQMNDDIHVGSAVTADEGGRRDSLRGHVDAVGDTRLGRASVHDAVDIEGDHRPGAEHRLSVPFPGWWRSAAARERSCLPMLGTGEPDGEGDQVDGA